MKTQKQVQPYGSSRVFLFEWENFQLLKKSVALALNTEPSLVKARVLESHGAQETVS